MARKKLKNKKTKGIKKPSFFTLPGETRKTIIRMAIFIAAIIIILSFFNLAGLAGQKITAILVFLIGRTAYLIPLILIFIALISLKTQYTKFLGPIILAIIILIVGISGFLESLIITNIEDKQGGLIGFVFSWPFIRFFGDLVSQIVFGGLILIGTLILWQFLIPYQGKTKDKQELKIKTEQEKPLISRLIKRVINKTQDFKIKQIALFSPTKSLKIKSKEMTASPIKPTIKSEYLLPPLDLLEAEKGKPMAGDTITNSAIIKKTLENFGLTIEMSEINIGPTVTQYALKPAEGIKLSKITALSNNLSLALASHPIRIEAPIPGKSLVGIEIPNRERCRVRLKDLISSPNFQNSASVLSFVLGRDVSGNPLYADLAKMPHLLVAGSTGTGKTIFLNSLILSLLYRNSPETLRIILIDPKRVEFSTYQELPHLLTPAIVDSQKSVNALKWLTSEMERRFDVLSENGSRDILSYNTKVLPKTKKPIPYIVLIIDELADLIAARGKEIEAGIVRLAQMARAVGIHLVVATQRPSVEVITGLIKANISSRITFQVASQIDSRTILDMAGAEKLLGLGDMLFVSAETAKPKRIQGAYISEKEIRNVVDWIKLKAIKSTIESSDPYPGETDDKELPKNDLAKDLETSLESFDFHSTKFSSEKDVLYEEAKKIVIEAKKASASLLQRRLSIGYARAARLLDILEENGIVGHGQGAKPREVYFEDDVKGNEEENGWQKI
ncbi:MAG: DNA translocase FtsK [Candidatus Nealsonbacteria bacterium]|nr:DNA translocase FtsK [Candidatus Nealsonbacteria bacterium]